MNDDQLKAVMVVLTPRLADASLRVANDAGMSRSAWLRKLIRATLDMEGTGHE